MVCGGRAQKPPGRRGRALPAGQGLHPARGPLQPSRDHAQRGPGVAPGRGVHPHPRTGLPSGLLLPSGLPARFRTHRGAPRLSFHAPQGEHDGQLRPDRGRGTGRRPGRLHLPHRLFHLAPPERVHGPCDPGESVPKSAQIQLLAHGPAATGLEDRPRLRLLHSQFYPPPTPPSSSSRGASPRRGCSAGCRASKTSIEKWAARAGPSSPLSGMAWSRWASPSGFAKTGFNPGNRS